MWADETHIIYFKQRLLDRQLHTGTQAQAGTWATHKQVAHRTHGGKHIGLSTNT